MFGKAKNVSKKFKTEKEFHDFIMANIDDIVLSTVRAMMAINSENISGKLQVDEGHVIEYDFNIKSKCLHD